MHTDCADTLTSCFCCLGTKLKMGIKNPLTASAHCLKILTTFLITMPFDSPNEKFNPTNEKGEFIADSNNILTEQQVVDILLDSYNAMYNPYINGANLDESQRERQKNHPDTLRARRNFGNNPNFGEINPPGVLKDCNHIEPGYHID